MEEKEMIDCSKICTAKVYTKRHLELAVVAIENDIVTFKVADQFYFGDEFSKQSNKHEFIAKNGATIRLGGKLEWDEFADILLLRRFQNISNVDETAKCNVHNFADIMEAVTEYNETDGKGYEKPWPQNNDRYYCISEGGLIYHTNFHDDYAFDNNRLSFGNCFRTREEAESARERVKKALEAGNE